MSGCFTSIICNTIEDLDVNRYFLPFLQAISLSVYFTIVVCEICLPGFTTNYIFVNN